VAISHKVFSSRALNVNSATYVGEAGRLFYEQTTGTGIAPVLKYSDGVTPGGLPLSGSSLTFSSSTPPLHPTDGILWWNTNDGRLYIYYDNSWVDASPDVQGAVTEIIAGTGTQVSTSTGAVTVWALPAQSITTTATSTSTSGLTVDLSGPTFVTWQPTSSVNKTITLSGFTPGRKVELWITPHDINDVFTVTGVTTGQCSDGVNTFTLGSVGASQQKSFILQFYCTTNAIGGVWIYGNGTL